MSVAARPLSCFLSLTCNGAYRTSPLVSVRSGVLYDPVLISAQPIETVLSPATLHQMCAYLTVPLKFRRIIFSRYSYRSPDRVADASSPHISETPRTKEVAHDARMSGNITKVAGPNVRKVGRRLAVWFGRVTMAQ